MPTTRFLPTPALFLRHTKTWSSAQPARHPLHPPNVFCMRCACNTCATPAQRILYATPAPASPPRRQSKPVLLDCSSSEQLALLEQPLERGPDATPPPSAGNATQHWRCLISFQGAGLMLQPPPPPPPFCRQCKPALALLKQLSERGPDAAALQRGHERFFNSQYSQVRCADAEAARGGGG
eukprot:15492-Chlamydomonas_euryale.AAC.1